MHTALFLNLTPSLLPPHSSITWILSFFHAGLTRGPHPLQAWTNRLFTCGDPFNKGMLFFSIEMEKSSNLALLFYRQLQNTTEFEWGNMCEEAAFHPIWEKLQKHTREPHRLQWKYSYRQYWSDPVSTELWQGRAYVGWFSSISRNLSQQKYGEYFSLVHYIFHFTLWLDYSASNRLLY